MSRYTDVSLMKSVIAMIGRRRAILLEEYIELTDADPDDYLCRDLRLKKNGAIEECRNIMNDLQKTIDETP